METKAWETVAGSREEQQVMALDQWKVEAALAAVKAFALGPIEILSVCVALQRESATEITTGVVVTAVGFVGGSATSMTEVLETDAATAMALPGQVSALVRVATPALWREIQATLACPTEALKEFLRDAAS